MLLAPNAPWAHNNLAVAMAYQGQLQEASKHASRFSLHELPVAHHPFYYATKGLIAYRSGDAVSGRNLYLHAAGLDCIRSDPATRAMLMWHLVREEVRSGAPGALELAEILSSKTKDMPIPEIDGLKDGLFGAVAPPSPPSPLAEQVPIATRSEAAPVLILPRIAGALSPEVKEAISRQIDDIFLSRR